MKVVCSGYCEQRVRRAVRRADGTATSAPLVEPAQSALKRGEAIDSRLTAQWNTLRQK